MACNSCDNMCVEDCVFRPEELVKALRMSVLQKSISDLDPVTTADIDVHLETPDCREMYIEVVDVDCVENTRRSKRMSLAQLKTYLNG